MDQSTAGEQTIPGSQVQWTVNGQTSTHSTTFVDSTHLIASIPGFFLREHRQRRNLGSATKWSTSNQLPVQCLAGTRHLGAFAAIGAGRSNTTTLTVLGANFVASGPPQVSSAAASALRRANAISGENGSTVFLNGVAFITTFINTGTLPTITVPASMLISPAT